MKHITVLMFIFWHFKIAVASTNVKAEFQKVKSNSTGANLCAVDAVPTATDLSEDVIQCGLSCLQDNVNTCCEAFNFHESNGTCQKYCPMPKSFAAVPGCSAHGQYFVVQFINGVKLCPFGTNLIIIVTFNNISF